MVKNLVSTSNLVNSRVWIGKPKKSDPNALAKLGKVHSCVFHPKEKRFVGFIVRRPDIAWMISRDDVFVAYNGFDFIDSQIVVCKDPSAMNKGAFRALNINIDQCILWVGLPVMCKDGTVFGTVGSVNFDLETGIVDSLEISQGLTANALLGRRKVPASSILGFRRGIGDALTTVDAVYDDKKNDEAVCGAILVDDSIKDTTTEGGIAAAAGETSAKISYRVRKTIKNVQPPEEAEEEYEEDEEVAEGEEMINRGAYLVGRQLERARGMFSDFKEEYDKARYSDE